MPASKNPSRRYIRLLDLVALPLIALATAVGALWGGSREAIGVAVGGVLLLLDVHALAWLVARSVSGEYTRQTLVLVFLPAKYLIVIGGVYLAIIAWRLDGVAFAVGVSLVIAAVIGTAILHHLRQEEP